MLTSPPGHDKLNKEVKTNLMSHRNVATNPPRVTTNEFNSNHLF
jgi:hypothetical protein